MKRLVILLASAVALGVVCYLVQMGSYDSQIRELKTVLDKKQTIAAELKERAFASDEQSVKDKEYMEIVFGQIFTFYDLDGFKRARNLAADCGMPADFINSFYDTSVLDDMYADTMLDIVCRYNSADIYLLDRDENTSYYYVNMKLNMVKVSGDIELSFFVTMDNKATTERFLSVIYYTNKG